MWVPKFLQTCSNKHSPLPFRINEIEHVYWVSFLDGLQRVILFTEDPIMASGVHTIGEAELVDTDIVISMQGMGLSLVNDQEHLEIVYISISKWVWYYHGWLNFATGDKILDHTSIFYNKM